MGLLCEPTNMRLLLILAFFSSLLALSVGNPVPQRPGRPGAVVGRPRPGGRPGAVFGCFVVQGNFPKDLRSPKVRNKPVLELCLLMFIDRSLKHSQIWDLGQEAL